MRYLLSLIFLLLIVGCGNISSGENLETDKEVTSNDEAPKQRELTKEDKKYIELLKEEQFETIIKETENLNDDDPLKDYYFLASAFKKDFEILEASLEDQDDEFFITSYNYVLKMLEKIKVIPKDFYSKAEALRDRSVSRKQHFIDRENSSKEIENALREKIERDEQIDRTTENPSTVSIGMTKEEVLTEGWGRPKDINKTTTAYSTSEQWVYDNYKYLYFEDGILTSIQN